jgi:cGMP-dependent protein kinase
VIFEQGAEGTALYIIQSGEVAIFKDGEQVMTCGPGDYFGERALLKKEVRAASPKAVTDVVLLQIAKRDFDAYLGPLESTLQSTVKTYDEQNSRRSSTAPTPAGAKKEAWTKIPFEELEPIGTLGKGSFGYVRLMKHAKHPDQTFALKAVSKAVIVETGQQGHIMSEKKVMEELRHPFLIRLYQTYKDEHRLYFLLEPVLGGELFTLLRREALFDDHTSQFYAGCVVLAFECMHSLDIIYRDLKPENLLIDADGYIKVTDFGFAKRVDTAKTWTLCGTPDYLAPELVGGKGHNKGVDWWTLGILIWEMLAGQPPYYDDDQMRTYKKIVSDEPLQFPAENFTDEAKSILRKLLKKKPTQRLGVVKGGASLVKKHRWFNDLGKNAWTNLVNKEIPAPSKPDIADSSDLNNFEEVEEDDAVEPYIDDGTDWDAAF